MKSESLAKLTAPTVLVILMLGALSGCQGSRWAKRDPAYADKYTCHTDNPIRTVKQAVDARRLAGRSGGYTSFAAGSDPSVGEISAGGFTYHPLGKGMLESHAGVKGLIAFDDNGGGAGGIEAGVRLQSPTRLAPFVGISVFGGLGVSEFVEHALSSEGSSSTDDDDDTHLGFRIAPEVGIHYWVTPQWRLTTSVAQNFTRFSDAEQTIDYPTVGLSISYLNIPGYRNKVLNRPASECCEELPDTETGSYDSPSSLAEFRQATDPVVMFPSAGSQPPATSALTPPELTLSEQQNNPYGSLLDAR